MARPAVIFQRLAAAEYRKARDWYAERSIEVAERFRLAVNNSVDRMTADFEALPVVTVQLPFDSRSAFPKRAYCTAKGARDRHDCRRRACAPTSRLLATS
jgi:hypothetical protein